MTSIITILIIELIECVFGVNYVDVKNYNISLGVNVFHGRFDKDCKYFMFVGDLEPITQLRFGNELIFPSDTGSKNYNLFVEMFIKNNIKLVSFYVHTFHKGLLKEVKRKVISISYDTYSYIGNEEFMYNIDKPILVSVDIGPKPKHPFINRLISEYPTSFVQIFGFTCVYKGFTLDGKSGPRYRFGYVYDSDHPALVGYTMYPYLIEECSVIKIYKTYFNYENRSNPNYESSWVQLYDKNQQKYELRPILGKEYWFLRNYSDEIKSDAVICSAINLYKKYSKHGGIPLVTLDISELASPEIFGIEKVTGSMANNWTYKLYKLKKEFEKYCKIRTVIDPTIKIRNIFIQKKKYYKYNVEVYRNSEKTYVYNSFNEYYEEIVSKDLKIFKKTNEEKYDEIHINDYPKTVKMMKKWYPIKLDVTVDEEQPSLFEKKEISNKELTIHHFSINETNDFGESILNKYVFGRVFRTTSFELGNIPQEPFRKHRVMIVGDINTNKFIVRNKSTLDNLSTPQYQLFRLRI
ncbi:hypothetical protein TpMuguga_03g00900 [Theileria parva strain Muguga]|uniref:Uncharacterized protein n=1 Tax=Theileria parva TaxID=5875 RepID=Q4MZQ9_THEPA|nr:uncharacterized protein TpMuguga_03g00900 [Theileria parva strain Muguga]EAN31202.1 hypothetical protein TpMuguga_03g00900 [Theileria parva strain Muguga]|eukprot:XP_763485.1 hypothetical protein [Theileria parva strain Muguga]